MMFFIHIHAKIRSAKTSSHCNANATDVNTSAKMLELL